MGNNPVSCIDIFGQYVKPNRVAGFSKHYHLRFDPKLGHVKCKIIRIPCSCVACTNTLNKPWVPGLDHAQQPRYQPIVGCTYHPESDSFNNWNIIHFTNKTTCSEEFDEVHKVFLDGISTNMVLLLHTG